jgi:hypothetical protein
MAAYISRMEGVDFDATIGVAHKLSAYCGGGLAKSSRALAARLTLAGEKPEAEADDVSRLSKALSALRISHAFPVADEREAELPIPASAVYWYDDESQREEDERHIFGDAIGAPFGHAPMFRLNGKEVVADFVLSAKKETKKAWRKKFEFPQLEVPLLPRMRVGMNEDADGQRIALDDRAHTASDEKLFSSVHVPVKG